MATLYGPDGEPIDLKRLKAEQAAPSITGVRQIMSGHPAQGLTPSRLARILRAAEDGDPMRYLELAEEMEEKDLHYASVLGTRKRSVAQLPVTVHPASDSAEDEANAELVRGFLNRQQIEEEIVDVLDAVGKGFSVTEIIWETSERQWMPRCLKWRFPQWFSFDRDDGETLLLRSETGAGFEPLAPFKFIRHFHKAKSGLPIRGGLARAAAWGYLFKNYTLKDWIAFIEVYGQPIRVGKYHPSATPEERETLLRAVANIGTDAAAIIPQSMVIEFVRAEAAREVGGLYKEFAEYIDGQISKAVLGQTLTTEVGDKGSFAAAKVHGGVKDDIERADCKQLASTFNRDLVRPIVDLNRGPQKAYPLLEIGRPEAVDVPVISEALAKLVPMGLRVRQSEVRAMLAMADPESDDELLTPPAAPAPSFLPALTRDRTRLARAAAEDGAAIDSIDRLIAEIDGWERVMAPIVDPIRALLDRAGSLEEARQLLQAAIGEMDSAALEKLLGESMFAARIAGAAGAPINDHETLPGGA